MEYYSTITVIDKHAFEHIVCYKDDNGIETLDGLYDYEYKEYGNAILYFEDSEEDAEKVIKEIIKIQKYINQ